MSGRMKGLARGRQMLLALLLVVNILPADSQRWPDNRASVTPPTTEMERPENGTSVIPTNETEYSTGSTENGTSVIPTNETEYSTGSTENGTSVIPTNETDYSTGSTENGTSVIPTTETEYSTELPDHGAMVRPTNTSEPDPPVTEPSRRTSSAPDRKVETQLHITTEDRFHYDYRSLRVSGLVMAAVFFLMGILILLVGGVSLPRCRSCRIRKGQTYNVVQPSQNPVQETRKDSEVTLLDSGVTAV